jgi:hypothetical protein
MPTSNILIKKKPKIKKLQSGGTSDRNANIYGLNTKTYRFTDWIAAHEGLQPQVSAPSLLPRDYTMPINGVAGDMQKLFRQQNALNTVNTNNLSLATSTNRTALAGAPTTTTDAKKPGLSQSTASSITGIAGLGLTGAGSLVEAFKKDAPLNTWGIAQQTAKGKKSDVTSSALKGAGTGLATGASIGSLIGPWGTVIGGVVGGVAGGVIGLLKAKKKIKADDKQYLDSTQQAYESYTQKANAQQYAAMGMHGAKLAVMTKIKDSKRDALSYKSRKFKVGGKLNKVGEVNVIPAGTLHKENNNLGQKDKGIPIIDETGKKVFEVEREELILRLKTTKAVEDMVSKYKKSNNSQHLVALGKLLSKEIMTNTHDLSGKFGLEATT